LASSSLVNGFSNVVIATESSLHRSFQACLRNGEILSLIIIVKVKLEF
jgi:hypothetical protein